ncbi:MAG: hypothetical protein M3O15_01220, partial [Acidobacteriota bacterium]|nr:hypothetical protein [Acidobacteriota bacterium]
MLRRWVVRPFVWGLLAIVLLLLGAVAFVGSRFAHARATALLTAQLSEFLGRQVHLGSVSYDFLPPAVELHDLIIPGPRPADPPVVAVPLVRVELDVSHLDRRHLRIEQVDVVRPRIYLQWNAAGGSNLPPFPRREGAAQHLEIEIGHILLEDGVVQLNERHSPLTVDARALWGRATGAGGGRLSLLLTAQEVVTNLPNMRHPYPFTLSAKGSLLPGKLQLSTVRLAGPDLAFQVAGTVGWQGINRVALAYDVRGAARFLNRVGWMEEPIDAALDITGRFDLAGGRGGDWSYSGTLASPRVAVLHRVFRDLAAQFKGDSVRLEVEVVHAGYDGGKVSGPVRVETGVRPGPRGGRPVMADLLFTDCVLQSLLIDQFPEQFAGRDGPVVELASRVSGRLRYQFQSADTLQGSGQAELRIFPAPGLGRGLPVAATWTVAITRGVLSSSGIPVNAAGQ